MARSIHGILQQGKCKWYHPTQSAALFSSSSAASPKAVSTFFTDLMEKHSISAQQNRIKLGTRLFRAAQYQALQPEWFQTLLVPKRFRAIHGLLSMHVWFLHKRLMAESDAGVGSQKTANLLLQEELFDLFWNDTRSRIRSLGVNEIMVNKHLKDAQQMTFLHVTQYDHAFSNFKDDPQKRFEVICDAVWRQVLLGGPTSPTTNDDERSIEEDPIDDDVIRKIGAYVEYQYDNIMFKLPDDYFEEGRIGWGNLPDFSSNVTDSNQNNTSESLKEHSVKVDKSGMDYVDDEWVEVLTDAGESYYWNVLTNQTSWKHPMNSKH
jgi:cytochrome b pre-mRNA-processing protein 3